MRSMRVHLYVEYADDHHRESEREGMHMGPGEECETPIKRDVDGDGDVDVENRKDGWARSVSEGCLGRE